MHYFFKIHFLERVTKGMGIATVIYTFCESCNYFILPPATLRGKVPLQSRQNWILYVNLTSKTASFMCVFKIISKTKYFHVFTPGFPQIKIFSAIQLFYIIC